MGNYLSDAELAEAQKLLELVYSFPYGVDMVGPVWEQILARVKGGTWSQKRDNRPNRDIIVGQVRYSVKTEKIDHAITKKRQEATDFLGYHEDLIVARPPVDELLKSPDDLYELSANQLGALVLQAYNTIAKQNWDRFNILLRLRGQEFICWEMEPPIYDIHGYQWIDSSKSKGQSRNINSSPRPAKFKWTSRGSQFYVRYTIPADADIISITPQPFTWEELLSLRR